MTFSVRLLLVAINANWMVKGTPHESVTGHDCNSAASLGQEQCRNEAGYEEEALMQTKTRRRGKEKEGTDPASKEPCYGKLPGQAVNQGSAVGLVTAQSESECQTACSGNSRCQSASFCPGRNDCWLRDRVIFGGAEAVRAQGDCRTLYRTPCDGSPPRSTLRVVSYNLFWWNAFSKHPEKGRRITDNIRHLQPDVLGAQECQNPAFIQGRTGLLPASKFSDSQGIFIMPGLFTVGETGSRDLGATGKWGPRFVTWVHLTSKHTGRAFWHFNTHWCIHSGYGVTCDAGVRYRGARNMLNLIREKAGGAPAIITGDFNNRGHERGPQLFLQSGFRLAKWNYMDAVLYSRAHWRVLSARTGEMAGSDHEPVIVELEPK